MKITYIASSFPKISETFVLGQITELMDRGHDVDIISITKSTEDLAHEDIDKYNLPTRTQYVNKSPSSLGFEFNEELLSSLIFTDIIHTHFAGYPATWALKFSKMLDIPFVITTHAYDIYINPDIEDLRNKFEMVAKIITISNYNKEYLLKLLGCNYEQKIDVIRCGTDLNKFKYIERINKDVVKILFIGRLIEKKGISYAIEAFNKILEVNQNIELRIIGDGPLIGEIEKLIQKLNLNGKVFLLGTQTQSTVLKEIDDADIFFLPSLTAENGDREGIPVSIIEASAAGLPIVSTIHSGIPEIVINGETGFLVPEKDTAAMAERLKQLILDPELRVKMGKAGRAHVETHYDRKNEIDNLEKLFVNLLGNKQLISDMSENQVSTIRERIRTLGVQLSKLDSEIRVELEEIKEKNRAIAKMNSELNLKDERITTLQNRLDEIESRPMYKAYVKMMNIFKYIIDLIPR